MNARTERPVAGEIPPAVARRAVKWLVELQAEDVGEATRCGFEAWLQQHPDHARAWQRITLVNDRLRSMAGVSSIAHATLAEAGRRAPRSPQRRQAMKALTGLLVAGGAAWAAHEQAPWGEWTADARTGVGERRTLTLEDGSVLAINTGSAVNLRFTRGERRVQLVDGEILVTTGPDRSAHRPFIVETGHGTLRPLGTRFAVRQDDDAARVEVYEGAVAVQPYDRAGQARVVRTGEGAAFTRSAVGPTVAAREEAIAWADGMIVASGMRLADFLAELSRHRPGWLHCDPAVAGLRVSGTFPLGDTDRILDALRSTLPLDVQFLTRYWVRLRPARG